MLKFLAADQFLIWRSVACIGWPLSSGAWFKGFGRILSEYYIDFIFTTIELLKITIHSVENFHDSLLFWSTLQFFLPSFKFNSSILQWPSRTCLSNPWALHHTSSCLPPSFSSLLKVPSDNTPESHSTLEFTLSNQSSIRQPKGHSLLSDAIY